MFINFLLNSSDPEPSAQLISREMYFHLSRKNLLLIETLDPMISVQAVFRVGILVERQAVTCLVLILMAHCLALVPVYLQGALFLNKDQLKIKDVFSLKLTSYTFISNLF